MSAEAPASNSPLPTEQLEKIATEACVSALGDVETYEHDKVNQWSSQIINTILQSLISATSTPSEQTESPPSPPATQYRFNVTCTIIQQSQSQSQEDGSANGDAESAGRRGMHTASGAYWDVTRDGMWTFKYPGAEEKGMDLVLSVVWFGTSR